MTRKAGVLVITNRQNQSLVLTQRSKEMPIHAGEVSFPGGRMQPEDQDIQSTALRETFEEIGIHSDRIRLIRPMDKVMTLTGYEISPYWAEVDSIVGYQLQIEEVDQLIELPMTMVLQRNLYESVSRQFRGITVKTLRFHHPDHFIWGATAKIMLQLVDLAS